MRAPHTVLTQSSSRLCSRLFQESCCAVAAVPPSAAARLAAKVSHPLQRTITATATGAATAMSRRTRASLKAELLKEAKASPSPCVSEPSPSGSTPLLLPDQASWQDWLQHSHRESSGLWLQIAKKNANKPSVTYEEALDVALCFGWIDGQRKAFDDQHFIQRFTPRRKNSLWSKRNVDKVMMLTQAQRMTPAGQAEVNAAKADGRWDRAYSSASVMEVPVDFEEALKENEEAKKFFDALNKTQRYVFLWRIETTRRPETRKRKIEEFVDLLSEHKLLH